MYEMILFDVDGVLLSEKRCFDTTCLCGMGTAVQRSGSGSRRGGFRSFPDEETIRGVRREVFAEENMLEWLKSHGVIPTGIWWLCCLGFSFRNC